MTRRSENEAEGTMGKVIKIPTLGSRVKEERRAWGMSLDDLAKKAKLSKAQVWSIETGRSDPKVSTAVRLADALSMSVARLVTGKDDGYHRGYQAALRNVRAYASTE